MLDLTEVSAFLTIVDMKSFTRAAEVLGTTQPVISARLKKLEAATGRRLLERHPRLVRLSAEGEAFLPAARALMVAHDAAFYPSAVARQRLRIGISEHAAGHELPQMLAKVAAASPHLRLEVQLGLSNRLLDAFDDGTLDAVIVRSDASRRDGEFLRHDPLGWYAAPSWQWTPDAPLPLLTLSSDCGMRVMSAQALDGAGIGWADAFIGGGIAAVTAAVMAGLGVAPLARRIAPHEAVEVGRRLGLPPLPASRIMLHASTNDAANIKALRTLSAFVRSTREAA
jgi:DNA-binding transcriptional LysR family regulator